MSDDLKRVCDEVDSHIAQAERHMRYADRAVTNAADSAAASIAHSLHALTVMFRFIIEDEFAEDELR